PPAPVSGRGSTEEDYVEVEAVAEAPPRERRRHRDVDTYADEEIDEQERPRKLGSLAQAARGRKLTALRIILFIVGGLQLAVSISLLATIRDQARRHVDKALRDQGIFVPPPFVREQMEDQLVRQNVVFHTGLIVLSGIYILFGFIVKLYPLPIAIVSLVLYL